MNRYLPEPKLVADKAGHTAILLVNLGTPEAPTAPAVRRYLKEFLWDPRVVEIPRIVWWLILNLIILVVRPAKSAEKYAKIWTSDGSPLKVHTERQAKLLQGWLGEQGPAGAKAIRVAYAMRYGQPSVADTLSRLKREGAARILVLPLYPQFAASTTASVMDAVSDWIKLTRNPPELRWVRSYPDHPAYIAALAASVKERWARAGRPNVLLMSFHGLPKRSLTLGDPYFHEAQRTGRCLAAALGLGEADYRITFQSRFGRAEWLQPYTQATLEKLARDGAGRVDVVCPGFVADCLETLEEISLECRDAFLAAGGKEFHYLPCLNERTDWIAALGDLSLNALEGWPLAQPDPPGTTE